MVGSVAVVRSTEGGDALLESVHEVMRAVFRRMAPALESERISMGHFWAMHMISSLGSVPQSRIARHLGVSAPTLCAKIDELEAAGLVVRHRSERDHRIVQIALTPKGRKAEARVWSWIGQTMGEAAVGLPREDLATAIRVFRDINRRLDSPTFVAGVRA
jgi:DNA-binding MarR family transcriptional regulator